MASLSGATIASTYATLIKLDANDATLVAGASGNAIQLKTGDNDTTPIYLNTDRVGIGTAAPAKALHVVGTTGMIAKITGDQDTAYVATDEDEYAVAQLYIENVSNSGGEAGHTAGIGFAVNSDTHGGRGFIGLLQPDEDLNKADFVFKVQDSSEARIERFRIEGNHGNIGIGTTVFSSGVRALGILNGTDPGGATSNTSCFFASGGTMKVTDAAGNTGAIDYTSDERVKDNITVIPDALSRLANLKGVTFNYVTYEDSSLPFKNKITDNITHAEFDSYGDSTRVGVIAQDVEKAYDGLDITNAVMTIGVESMPQDDEEGYVQETFGELKKTRDMTLIPLLIEAVKELSAKVEALENA